MSSLFHVTGAAYIQAAPGFVDVRTDPLQRRTAARAADVEGISGTIAVLTAEPEIVGNHLLQPHSGLRSDCVLKGRGDHGYFLAPLGVTVDKGVIQDFGHGLHRLSVRIVEPALAVGQRVCSGSEENGGKAVLNLPDVQFPVAGQRHGSSPPCLEEKVAHIPFPGKILGPEVSDVRFGAVEKSVLHNNLAPFVGFGMLVTGCYTIIGTASFPHGAMWQVILVVFKICFLIEKPIIICHIAPNPVVMPAAGHRTRR